MAKKYIKNVNIRKDFGFAGQLPQSMGLKVSNVIRE
jgi:hypothetical protein